MSFEIAFKLVRMLLLRQQRLIDAVLVRIIFWGNNVQFGRFRSNGRPFVSVARGATCILGEGLTLNNGLKGNPIGRPQPCVLFVDYGAKLVIGRNIGISATALVAHHEITIGDDVKIGGGVCIYDTDFHSLNATKRTDPALDRTDEHTAPVRIGNRVFIGAHSTILKGVTIGDNAIIGACSVVTKSIPANEVWAGNPAKFIRSISHNH
jgi:acetyltransferase-like isoleucine patch superfamily enzyme